MANRIYIKMYNPFTDTNMTLSTPLIDDPIIEMGSSFSSIGEMIPSKFMDALKLSKTFSKMEGVASAGLETLIDLPMWEKTEPIKLNIQLFFYTKTSAEKDVFEPIYALCSQSILQVKNKGTYSIPGVSMSAWSKMKDKGGTNVDPQKPLQNKDMGASGSTLISLEIPGIIYLPGCIVYNAKPTFSKNRTKSGYPVWGKVDLEIRSIYPANDEMLKDSKLKMNVIDIEDSKLNLPQ